MPRIPSINNIVSIYSDGGCVDSNPSPLGGTWAWLTVDEHGETDFSSGIITPRDVGLPAITNNFTELLAVIKGLERMQDGWSGVLYTDSAITLRRLTQYDAKMNGIPSDMVHRVQKLQRRLRYTVQLVGGHPTKAELKEGRTKKGVPCSTFNVFVDYLCTQEALKFKQNH